MAKPETALWTKLQPYFMEMGLDAHRVENVSRSGMPDVNYVLGWIELKHLAAMPVRPKTPVRVKTLVDRPEQATWLHRRWVKGGLCWLLVRVDRQLFMFSGWEAHDVRRGLTQAEFRSRAVWMSGPRGQMTIPVVVDLLRWLTADTHTMTPGDRAKFHRLRCMKTLEQVATDLGWTIQCLVAAEQQPGQAHTDDLLAYWEN